MPRCSQSVAALATALAKAQIELTNPEKSLIGTLPADRGQEPRTFRYASLASSGIRFFNPDLAASCSTTTDRVRQ